MRGKFIVFQGLDRTGKTTISKYIHQSLSEINHTKYVNFPDRTTPIGQMIDQYLSKKSEIKHQCLHLLFSANRWECIKNIEEDLKKGTNIICDRYWYSGVAYSIANGLDLHWCLQSDKGLIKPDLIIYLKGNPQKLSKRQKYGEEKYQSIQYQAKVANSFRILWQYLKIPQLCIIDTNVKDLQGVEMEVNVIIKKFFNFQ